MADALWRIAGGIGAAADPALEDLSSRQVMTQGIGFPLRPVDNVPTQGSGDVFEGVVPEGLFMQFMPRGYEEGKFYAKGSMIVGAGYQVISERFTGDYPFPVATAPRTFALPDFTPVEDSDSSAITSGSDFVFTVPTSVKTLRVQVPEVTANTTYRVKVTDITDPANVETVAYVTPALTASVWVTVTQINRLVRIGTIYRAELTSLNSGSSTQVVGGWNFEGVENTLGPAVAGVNRSQQHDIVRYHFTDLDGTDRKSEMLGAIENSTLTITQTSTPTKTFVYRITAVTDSGTYVTYGVALVSVNENGPDVGTTSTTLEIPTPLPTKYLVEAAGNGTPAWATMTGRLLFDGVFQAGSDLDAFGVDMEGEPADISDDWQVMDTQVI